MSRDAGAGRFVPCLALARRDSIRGGTYTQGRAEIRGDVAMGDSGGGRAKSWVHITRRRASRLYGLVRFLEGGPRSRDEILKSLGVGLRTFYRELDLLRRCGLRVRHLERQYELAGDVDKPEGRLPFPDPQLSFAEVVELAACDCDAGRRLAAMLASIVEPQADAPARKPRGPRRP